MKKTLFALILLVTTSAINTSLEARFDGAGFLGGMAAGSILGGAIGNGYYGSPYGYNYAPVYGAGFMGAPNSYYF